MVSPPPPAFYYPLFISAEMHGQADGLWGALCRQPSLSNKGGREAPAQHREPGSADPRGCMHWRHSLWSLLRLSWL